MKRGFVASSFDLMHPGYILMFQDAKTVCDYRGKSFTGDDLDIPIHSHDRFHNWSTTSLKRRIQGVNLI